MNEKKDASAVVGSDTPYIDKSMDSAQSISQDTPENQVLVDDTAKPGRGRWSKKALKVLPADAKVNAFAIKCYAEQLPFGFDYVKNAIKATDKTNFQVIAIWHDRDIVTDGIWQPATEKPHLHVIIRCVDRKKRIRIRTAMKQLGIQFRPGTDDSLWMNHGVETIGNFPGYATYLTHETDDAIKDAKEPYELWELISNLTEDEILRVRDGYTRVSDAVHKVTAAELEQLDKDAYALGYNMKNFNLWYNSQPFAVRSSAKMKTIKESYDRGVEVRIEENQEMLRVCIYIEGEPNTGKSYAAKSALVGKHVLCIGGGGTGKFDKLRPDHDAIVVDDDVCPNLLNMTDNYICRAYKRNSNNPAWAGQYFVVTSNLKFREWIESCGIRTTRKGKAVKNPGGIWTSAYEDTPHFEALLSRFFVCQLVYENGVNRLALRSPSTRGTASEQMQRADMFVKFQRTFNNTISQYKPDLHHVDFSQIVEHGNWD